MTTYKYTAIVSDTSKVVLFWERYNNKTNARKAINSYLDEMYAKGHNRSEFIVELIDKDFNNIY